MHSTSVLALFKLDMVSLWDGPRSRILSERAEVGRSRMLRLLGGSRRGGSVFRFGRGLRGSRMAGGGTTGWGCGGGCGGGGCRRGGCTCVFRDVSSLGLKFPTAYRP